MKKRLFAVLPAVIACAASALTLEEGFKAPPNSAKPHTWYHMMNGNVTKEGITCDFEALARAGVGGVQMFDAGCNVPPGPMAFNSPEWFDMFRHAAQEARRLGLEICIPNCSGWSSSGGPWNMPSNGMKQVVFTETPVKGGARFQGVLPRTKNDHGFYADIAVLAYPVPAADLMTFDGVQVKRDGKQAVLTSDKPFTVSALSYRLEFPWTWADSAQVTLEASDDGKTFRTVETYREQLGLSGAVDKTLRFHPLAQTLTARAIRVSFKASLKLTVEEFRPEARLRVANVRGKTFDLRAPVVRSATVARPDQVVARERVTDLTARTKDGALDWTAPAGCDWKLLRIGYVCNGRKNHPASDHGVGLEVDKLSASALDYHFDQYVTRLCDHLGGLAGKVESGFNNILVDSYEVGSQNWTQDLDKTFAARRGYSLVPYLPVFAGYVVGSTDETERFLEDFRRVVADLFAENYSGRLAELCHRHGLMLSLEPYGNCPADNLQYGEAADIPMGEFWSNAGSGDFNVGCGNSRYISHLAHVWGRRYAATESFTASPNGGGRWQTTPFSIKAQGDRAYAAGVNRIIYHRFTHQPWPGNKYLPGMTMGRWGMHLDRTQTWWPYSGEWFKYQARCQWMLQEGTFVADVLYFCGEDAPNQGGNTDGCGDANYYRLPVGYAWDVCATKAMKLLKVENGCVVVPGGVRYRVLALPPKDTMSEEMLAVVEKLVDAGAKVCATVKPSRAPGLRGWPAADGRVADLAARVWAKGVLACRPAEALERLSVAPDFGSAEVAGCSAEYLHRTASDADWYFVALNNRARRTVETSFCQTGRQPEIWDAVAGTVVDAPVWREEGGRTYVTLDLPPAGSAFVVFRKAATGVHAVKAQVKTERRPDPVPVDKTVHTLRIVKAEYGVFAPGDARVIDFTARLAARVKDGTLDVKIDNALAGGDPAYLTVKRARVTYVYDGGEVTKTLGENCPLTVPSTFRTVEPAADWEWRGKELWTCQPLRATVAASDGSVTELSANPPPAQAVDGAWKVSFPVDWYTGGTAVKTFSWPAVRDWTGDDDPDIRFFSGTATYETALRVNPVPPGARVVLDLGTVRNFAEVTVNGKTYPVLWKPPYAVDITDALVCSDNQTVKQSNNQTIQVNFSLRVTNLWPNRLIGDDALPADVTWVGTVSAEGVKEIGVKEIPDWVKRGEKSPTGRHTFTTWRHWAKDETPLPSGLLSTPMLRTYVPACP